jgi:hypothetical protein
MSESNLPEWEQLLSATENTDLREYRKLHPKCHDWNRVKEICADIAVDTFKRL